LSRDDLTLEKVLEEKKTFDTSLRFEKLGADDEKQRGWTKNGRSMSLLSLYSILTELLARL